MWNLFTIKMT